MTIKILDRSVVKKIEPDHDQFIELFRLTSEIKSLKNVIGELPILPEWREQIQRMEFVRAVHGTLAIEGSDIQIEQVENVAGNGSATSPTNKEKEASNALKAYDFIREWSTNNPEERIIGQVLKQIHKIITDDLDYYLNSPGQYRNQEVTFGTPRRKAVLKNQFDIEKAMSELANFVNSGTVLPPVFSDMEPISKAIVAHYMVTWIHPFIDGNGRVARAVEALILHHLAGFEPYCFPITAGFYYQEREQYFSLLHQTDKTADVMPFLLFSLSGLRDYLSEIKVRLLDKISHLLILDYLHQLRRLKTLLKRQVTLMESALRLQPMDVSDFYREPSIRGLYVKMSESTRKKDIRKLLDMNLLKAEEYLPSDGTKKRVRIYANWEILRELTLRLGVVLERPVG